MSDRRDEGFETWSSRDVLTADGQARPGQAFVAEPCRVLCPDLSASQQPGRFDWHPEEMGGTRKRNRQLMGTEHTKSANSKVAIVIQGEECRQDRLLDGDKYCGPVPTTANVIVRKQRSLGRR
ncbi:hypothetical protein BN1723_007815 [Verticillium longisporum]|uniref:Uncharacterized protein n=1 Tax=Verticillium longisporum TaxID=100787 RepID=A0A0G4NN24_VERLO|nr:hypothetical protein BN1723_007815 [Verticillium longisporum]